MRSVPISHSITGPLARSIGLGCTGAEREKALTNAGGLSGPPLGVHYTPSSLGSLLRRSSGLSLHPGNLHLKRSLVLVAEDEPSGRPGIGVPNLPREHRTHNLAYWEDR